ncbi:MAG: hypothetical protein U0230_26625 [Polyangiales bacterium]
MSRPLRFVPSCLAFVLAALGVGACSTPRYDVEVSFASDVTPSDVRFVELQLLPSCPSEADVASGQPPTGVIVAGVGLRQTEAASLPGFQDVDPGTYGLYARGFNATCTAVAAGCVTVHLEARGSKQLAVALGATTQPPGCDTGVCNDGECQLPDGGVDSDAGTDGGTNVDACPTNPCPGGQYCVDLPNPAAGDASGRSCFDLTVCGQGEYQTKAPTPTSNRECGTCSVCNSGQFETKACANGNGT